MVVETRSQKAKQGQGVEQLRKKIEKVAFGILGLR